MPRHRLSVLLFALLATGAVQAVEVGAPLPELSLTDAAEAQQALDPGIRRLVLTADRRGDKLLVEAVRDIDPAVLGAPHTAVIADISAAPGLIRRVIRRDLRERRYRTLIDQSGATRTLLPYRADHVTVVDLEAQRITAIRHFDQPAPLRALLAAQP